MGSALDVAIGLAFMYLLLALLVSTLQELLASMLSLRAKQLYDAIEDMLKDAPGALKTAQASRLAQKLFESPLIGNLAQGEFNAASTRLLSLGKGLPSYIPSKTFATALLEVLKGTPASQATGSQAALSSARKLVAEIQVEKVRATLTLFLDDIERTEQDADKQLQLLSAHIEQWFNDRMARVCGWYKRKAQLISLVLAVAISVGCNASTVGVASELWHNASLRAAVVASAQVYDRATASSLTSSPLPIGWHGCLCGGNLAVASLGWLMTAIAVSLGAGFWFDALGKLLNVRGSGARVSETDGKTEA